MQTRNRKPEPGCRLGSRPPQAGVQARLPAPCCADGAGRGPVGGAADEVSGLRMPDARIKAFHKPGGYKLLAICDCGCAEEV